MKTISKLLISAKLLFLLLLALSSCKDKKIEPEEEQVFICELVWTSIAVKIVNQHGEPVKLDDYYSIKTSTGEKISFKNYGADSLLKANGRYLVASDSQRNMITPDDVDFVFHGFKNDVEVVNQKFTIGHDGCHVQLISGPSTLTLNE